MLLSGIETKATISLVVFVQEYQIGTINIIEMQVIGCNFIGLVNLYIIYLFLYFHPYLNFETEFKIGRF